MGVGGRKDPRDRRRHQQNKRKKGSRARGRIGGRRGTVMAVREETDEKGKVTTEVTEEAFDLPLSNGLGKTLRTLRVKVNWAKEVAGPWKGEECVRSFVLSLVFRKTVEGITGLPVSLTRQRKLRKLAYDRVSIEKIPNDRRGDLAGVLAIGSGYDERGWRINFWKEGRGKRSRGKRFSGRPVHTVIDELSVLEWIFNSGLKSLYESQYLSSNRFLPKSDEQRVHDNTVAAGMKMAFGVNVGQTCDESSLHRTRLMNRLREVNEGSELAALSAFSETTLGKQTIIQEMKLELPEQRFYFSRQLKKVFALFNFPTMRYVMRVDLDADRVIIEPLRTDRQGRPLMKRYQHFLESTLFEEIDWSAFRGLTQGIGRIKIVVD